MALAEVILGGRPWRPGALGLAVVVAASVLLFVAHGCTEEQSDRRPSVLLITVDTLRADRLSCYGYAGQKTPAIDSLAAQGVLFEESITDMPWTTGAMASVMTSTFSLRHGVQIGDRRLADSNTTLAEMLKAQGYETGAVIGSFPLGSIYGLNQGFDTYDEEFTTPMAVAKEGGGRIEKVPDPSELGDIVAQAKWAQQKIQNDAYRPDALVSEHAIRWLGRHRRGPFLLWVHYFGPHERIILGTPAAVQEPRIIADYDRNLHETDAAIHKLLTAVSDLGLDEKLLVILHADHGQSLGEHTYVGHTQDIYNVSVHVPLLMRFPGRIVAGTRVKSLVRNVDILPTALDLVGVPIPPGLTGRSLVAAIEARDHEAPPAYSETYITTLLLWPLPVPELGTVLGPTTRRGIRTAKWSLIENQVQSPCKKGISPYRSAEMASFNRWQLRDAVDLAPEECNRLRTVELYDLAADPGETQNVAGAHPDVVSDFLRQLHSIVAAASSVPEKIHLNSADKERLRSLGYQPGDE